MATRDNGACSSELINVEGGRLEVFRSGNGITPIVSTAHPADVFGAGAARLTAEIAQTSAVIVNPRGLGGSSQTDDLSLDRMVDDLEQVRQRLGLPRWVFWGMSGGGWLAQIYARRYPQALLGIIVESACCSFKQRLADPACVLSPFFPAWRMPLEAHGLLADEAQMISSSIEDAAWTTLEGVGDVLHRREGPALLVSSLPVTPVLKRALPQFWAFDSRPWLAEVRLPALVLAGSVDPVVPVHRVREVHEAIAGSRFVSVEGGGHVPSVTGHAAAVEAIRRFLHEI